MIVIQKSLTADTRSCDPSTVSKETLLDSSRQHIGDVGKALGLFASKLAEAASIHDYDKLTEIDWFHRDFRTGFKETGWWDNHRRIHRHHLAQEDGVPEDVNLLDVLEFVADCVMAGMGRTGTVYELVLSDSVLQTALHNTVELLKSQVVIAQPVEQGHGYARGYGEAYQDRCENCDIQKDVPAYIPPHERDGWVAGYRAWWREYLGEKRFAEEFGDPATKGPDA